MSYINQSIISERHTITGINGLVGGSTNVFTTQTGKTWITTNVIVRPTAVSGLAIGTTIDIDDGTNPIIGSGVAVPITTTTGNFVVMNPIAVNNLAVPGGTTIRITNTAGTGTTLTLAVDIFGYYVT